MKNSALILDKEELREVLTEMILPFMQQMQQQHSKMFSADQQDELMSRKQAAVFLKISLVTLNEWTRQGIIQSRRIQGRG